MSGKKQGAGYDLFASIMTFKAALESLNEIGKVEVFEMSQFRFKKEAWELLDGDATMAVRRKDNKDTGIRFIVGRV